MFLTKIFAKILPGTRARHSPLHVLARRSVCTRSTRIFENESARLLKASSHEISVCICLDLHVHAQCGGFAFDEDQNGEIDEEEEAQVDMEAAIRYRNVFAVCN